jgi:hypothetical protein
MAETFLRIVSKRYSQDPCIFDEKLKAELIEYKK